MTHMQARTSRRKFILVAEMLYSSAVAMMVMMGLMAMMMVMTMTIDFIRPAEVVDCAPLLYRTSLVRFYFLSICCCKRRA